MAQQAKPNNMYHCEEARPQLSRSSTFVVKTVSGNWFNNDVKASWFLDFPFKLTPASEGLLSNIGRLPKNYREVLTVPYVNARSTWRKIPSGSRSPRSTI